MSKFLQCHRQPRAPRKRSVPSINNHPAIVDIFRKFYENGPCIQAISFRNRKLLLRNSHGPFVFEKTREKIFMADISVRDIVCIDVGDRWNKKLLGRLYFIISF